MTAPGGGPFRVRSLAATVYAPNLFFSIGQGAVVPIVALLALDLGATPALAGVVVALRGLGTMFFDLPAGVIVSRFGEKRSMVYSGIALAAISFSIAFSQSLWLYAALITAMGCTWSVWILARVAFATGSTPLQYRGRVMSMIGGVQRIGLLVGPLVGAVVVTGGGLDTSFLVLAALAAAASLTMALARTPEFVRETVDPVHGRITMMGVVREHRRILATAGTVAVTSQVLRSSREALIPLWGDHIGVAAGTIPLIFAASAAIESLLFYPVGILMDRKGRKWTAVPAMVLFTLGVAVIPLTSDVVSLIAAGMVMGLANGLGSGMNMTLGSDLSPLVGRSRFLGVWRLVTDVGVAGGPLLVAITTTLAGLAVSAVAVGAVGAVGVFVLWRLVPETLDR
jgi:MFS family permease